MTRTRISIANCVSAAIENELATMTEERHAEADAGLRYGIALERAIQNADVYASDHKVDVRAVRYELQRLYGASGNL
jgi:hypothetical protein